MSEALKPCPFCGGEGLARTREGYPWSNDDLWCVACRGCGCEVGWDDSKTGAIVAWNTRAAAQTTEGSNE